MKRTVKNKIDIMPATKEQAPVIAALIMEAMDYDCCRNFAGPDHTLDDFHAMMTELVSMDDSQYSYRNTIVAMEDAPYTVYQCRKRTSWSGLFQHGRRDGTRRILP